MKISWKGYAAFQESTGLGVTIVFFFKLFSIFLVFILGDLQVHSGILSRV